MKAEPDEPIFTLRGKDPVAPYLINIWAATRLGHFDKAVGILTAASQDPAVLERVSNDMHDKIVEALTCAIEMRAWRHSLKVAVICSNTSGQAHCRLDTGHNGSCDFS